MRKVYAGVYGYNHNQVGSLAASVNTVLVESDSDVEIMTENSFTSQAGLHYDRVAHYSMNFAFLDGKKHSGYIDFTSNIQYDMPTYTDPGVVVQQINVRQGKIYFADVSTFSLYWDMAYTTYPGDTFTVTDCFWTLSDITFTVADDINSVVQDIYDMQSLLKNYNIPMEYFNAYYAIFRTKRINSILAPDAITNTMYVANLSQNPVIYINSLNNENTMYNANYRGKHLWLYYSNVSTAGLTPVYQRTGETIPNQTIYKSSGGMKQWVITFDTSAAEIPNVGAIGPTQYIIPVYFGLYDECPDSILRMFGLDNDIMNPVSEDMSSSSSGFDTAAGQYMTAEDSYINNMDSALQNIDISDGSDLITNNGFISAANWVRVQFTNLVIGTPFELVLMFSLVLGLALIFIGKVR